MRKLFSSYYNDQLNHIWLFIFRLCVSGFMLTHGVPKLERLMAGGEIQFADPFGIGPTASLALSAFAEFFCSILIILGLATRLATIPLIINMSVTVIFAHADDPFAGKEKALLFLVCYLTILIFGPGKYSADRYIR
ncbi:DoxX family protein [soil metagenome]